MSSSIVTVNTGGGFYIRNKVLDDLGAGESVKNELLCYNENHFDPLFSKSPLEFPLGDEPFLNTWKRYLEESKRMGVFETLKIPLPQLRFPIEKGISQADYYTNATRRGVSPDDIPEATGLVLTKPGSLKLILYQSTAGRIPVIITKGRRDFIAVTRALSGKNEPVDVPDSMGALMVAGFNNWDRINTLKARWKKDNPFDFTGAGWATEFKRITAQKELYQDRFMILSDGPYSGVSAHDLGMTQDQWRDLSITVRCEHECTHYFTRRLFGSMKNRVFDELIADYMGIVEAFGTFRTDYFLNFIGLEGFPKYRPGARLENYRGDPPLSDKAFKVLQVLVKHAAKNLEQYDSLYRSELESIKGRAILVTALSSFTIEELASAKACLLIRESVNRIVKTVKKGFLQKDNISI